MTRMNLNCRPYLFCKIYIVNYILKGVEVNKETIGLDVIKQVGICGNSLAEEHTFEFMRQSYHVSKIFNREAWNP